MLNTLLREARDEVAALGRIRIDTAAKLMAHGIIVEKLENRLLDRQPNEVTQ